MKLLNKIKKGVKIGSMALPLIINSCCPNGSCKNPNIQKIKGKILEEKFYQHEGDYYVAKVKLAKGEHIVYASARWSEAKELDKKYDTGDKVTLEKFYSTYKFYYPSTSSKK